MVIDHRCIAVQMYIYRKVKEWGVYGVLTELDRLRPGDLRGGVKQLQSDFHFTLDKTPTHSS